MENKLWNITETIVKRLREAIETDPREAKNFLDEISKEYWFDYLEEELKPEPPTVRPMSELPEGRTFDFIALIIRKDNGFKFHECMEKNDYLVQGSHEDFAFFKSEGYENEEFKMLGWLYELPNPNDIKL